MLLPEDRLDILLIKLRALPRGDRAAILNLLDRSERHQIKSLLKRLGTKVPGEDKSLLTPPFQRAVEQAFAKTDKASPLTPAVREVVVRAIKDKREQAQGPSLAQAVGELLRPKARE